MDGYIILHIFNISIVEEKLLVKYEIKVVVFF